jgi:hypothetical protein
MSRYISIGNIAQALIYGAGWYWLKERWALPAQIALVCAVLQVVAAGALLAKKERVARWCSILCLAAMAFVIGQFIDAANHLTEAYGSDARKLGERSLENIWLATPWALFFPVWQALHGGLRTLWVPAIILLLPLLFNSGGDGPLERWPVQPEMEAAAQAAFSLWHGQEAEIPLGSGPSTILLTPFQDGRPGAAVRGDGDTLREAVNHALQSLDAPKKQRTGLVLDVARAVYSAHSAVPAGDGGGLGKTGGTSPVVAWRPGKIGTTKVALNWTLPRPKIGKQQPALFDSVLADSNGTYSISGAWTSPPLLTAETALEAALAGGRLLAHHQSKTGRFAYTVRGPSGKVNRKGYNFPRHAGTSWFLARLAQRTNDPIIEKARDNALAYMVANTITVDKQRAYLGDPRRSDGKAWVGTTALATLAAVAADHPQALPWGRFVAGSVDEFGQVRGEMLRTETEFHDQNKNPYGQGQTTLAIAALVRAGHEEFRPTLERLATYLDGDYAPGGVGRLVVLDEHWTCLASLAIQDALGEAHGTEICHAYLAKESGKTPNNSSRIRPFSGAAGGLAEAVVAGAVLDGEHRSDAIAYGQWFLRSAYRHSDSALLPRPAALKGGFRDTPYRLDVRMDAVQHIGCALLGIEALLGKVHPGSMP